MKLRNEENNMKIYKVYWEDILIGTLSINNNMHKYIPNFGGIKSLEGKAPLLSQLTKPYDWGEPIPFFASRISNCERFGTEDYTYNTDHYKLEPVIIEKENIEER